MLVATNRFDDRVRYLLRQCRYQRHAIGAHQRGPAIHDGVNDLFVQRLDLEILLYLNRLPLHLRLHEQANMSHGKREPVIEEFRFKIRRRLKGDAQQMYPAGHVEQIEEFRLGLDMVLECAVEIEVILIRGSGKAWFREANCLIKMDCERGPSAALPFKDEPQRNLIDVLGIWDWPVCRVGIGQSGQSEIDVEKE